MWIYQGKPYEPTEETLLSYQGFVYEIEELDTGKKYIGKKFFWSSKILPITKTRKRKKRVKIQSDWKTYYGSHVELKENVIHKGEYRYKRTILRLCSTKGECSYYEAKLQFDNDVLLNDDYYNSFIGCKIHAKHLGK